MRERLKIKGRFTRTCKGNIAHSLISSRRSKQIIIVKLQFFIAGRCSFSHSKWRHLKTSEPKASNLYTNFILIMRPSVRKKIRKNSNPQSTNSFSGTRKPSITSKPSRNCPNPRITIISQHSIIWWLMISASMV